MTPRIYRDFPRFDRVFSTWDCTFKDLESARGTPDYVAGHAWGLEGTTRLYLLPWEFRQQTDVTGTIAGIFGLRAHCQEAGLAMGGIHIEDKASGPAVIQLLRQKVPGLQPWPGDRTEARKLAAGSKESRARAAAAFVRAGNVFLPSPDIAPWIAAWLSEVEGYPQAAFDDRVDGLSMACALAFLDQTTNDAVNYWSALGGLGI